MAAGSILVYHAIGDCPHPDRPHNCLCIPTTTFARQMSFLAASRRVVSLEDLVGGRVSGRRPAVAITFDDGYRNTLETATPILRRHGFVATIFVPTKWIGERNMWDEGAECFPLEIMNADELRAMEDMGISVESHGHAHVDLEQANQSEVADDLATSFALLSDILGRKPRYVAYPYGRQSRLTRAVASEVGFERGFLFDRVSAGPMAHERVSMDGRESRVRFQLKTAGGYLGRRNSRLGAAAASLIRLVVPRPASVKAA